MSKSDVSMAHWLREKMTECELEIEYLEEVLVTTSGANDQLITDLAVEKRRLQEYTAEWERYCGEIMYNDM